MLDRPSVFICIPFFSVTLSGQLVVEVGLGVPTSAQLVVDRPVRLSTPSPQPLPVFACTLHPCLPEGRNYRMTRKSSRTASKCPFPVSGRRVNAIEFLLMLLLTLTTSAHFGPKCQFTDSGLVPKPPHFLSKLLLTLATSAHVGSKRPEPEQPQQLKAIRSSQEQPSKIS